MVQDFVPAPRRYSKKSSRRVPPAAFLQLLHKIASACSASREVAAWSGGLTPPSPLLRPHSPSVTDAVLFGQPTGL